MKNGSEAKDSVDGLTGVEVDGRRLRVEIAKRARAHQPTPGECKPRHPTLPRALMSLLCWWSRADLPLIDRLLFSKWCWTLNFFQAGGRVDPGCTVTPVAPPSF